MASETRVTEVRPGEAHHLIDITSTLRPTEWPLTLGPTRHAYFNARAAESMRVDRGGRMREGEGWVRVEGPLGGGARAGLAVMVPPPTDWFATEWGVVTAQPWRNAAAHLPLGEAMTWRARFMVHDGDGGDIDVDALANF